MSQIKNPFFALSFVSSNNEVWTNLNKTQAWKPWSDSLNDKSEAYYQSIYHGNFYYQVFNTSEKDSSFLRKTLISQNLPLDVRIDKFELTLSEIQVFMTKTGFSLFTVSINAQRSFLIDEVIELVLKLKNQDCKFEIEGERWSINELVANLGSVGQISKPSQVYTFQNHSYSEEIDWERLEPDCFHLANFIPYSIESTFETTANYYRHQIDEYGIGIYKNWFALSLNDSFVRLSQPNSDPFSRWSNDFFSIYLYNLCVKNYLGFVNSELVNVTGLSSKMERKKNEFIEFLNDTQYHRISSKFLPNELFESIGRSLGIPAEMQILEKKLQRISNYFRAKRDKAFNTALIVITFLSVFTVIFDLSMWFEKLGFMGDFLWPIGSLISAGLIVVIITVFFTLRVRR